MQIFFSDGLLAPKIYLQYDCHDQTIKIKGSKMLLMLFINQRNRQTLMLFWQAGKKNT